MLQKARIRLLSPGCLPELYCHSWEKQSEKQGLSSAVSSGVLKPPRIRSPETSMPILIHPSRKQCEVIGFALAIKSAVQ